MNETASAYEQWENILASSILFFPIFFGLGCYACFCIVYNRLRRTISNAYYQFVISIVFSNAPMLLMFAAYAAPCTLLQRQLGGLVLNSTMGAISNLLWFSSLPMYQCIAVNRLVALKYESLAKRIYTQKNVCIMIACCWIYGLLYFAISLHPCCYFKYTYVEYAFGYDINRTGSVILSYVDLTNSTVTVTICLSFNTATFLHIRKKNKEVRPALSGEANLERQKAEKKLFALFFIIIIYLLIHDAIFIIVPYVTTSKWGGLLTCATYIVHLSLDGITNTCFNSVIRKELRKIFFAR